MPMTGRRLLLRTLPVLAAAPSPARAQPVAGRPARILIGVPPGGGMDIVARLYAEALRERYAPQVVVENRPGASTRLAVEAVKAAPPDGTTILQTPLPVMTLFPHVFPRTTRYDALTDFVPVAVIGTVGYGWVVRADHPASTLVEFLAWARERGGSTFAPPVIGAPQHMIGLEVARRSGVPLTAVSYRGGPAALQDVLSGQLASVISTMGDVTPLLQGGQTKLIAVSTRTRLTSWPSAPTLGESGFGGLPEDEAYALLLPAGASAERVTALYRAVVDAAGTAAVRDGLARLEMTVQTLSPADTAARIRAERDQWAPIVRAVGFNADD